MTIPTLQGLQTALSGLIAEQNALDTAGNNIANANTEGYSRETVLMQPNTALEIPAISDETGTGAQLGTGVGVANITRIRNIYLDAQFRAQNSALSNASTQTEVLKQAEAAFDEPSSDALATQLSNFYSAWSSLASSPTSEAAKEAVTSAGERLVDTFHQLSSELATIGNEAGEQYTSLTGTGGEVELDAQQIAQLNGQIKLDEEAGQTPNNLLDQRDLLLDKLSALGNVNVTEEADHTDTVSFGNAAEPLVAGTKVDWPQTLTEGAGGQLGALLELTGSKGALTGLQTGLDGVAEALTKTVNEKLTTPFFSGTTAATIAVAVKSSEVKASAGTEAVGGNKAAEAVAALRGGSAEEGYAALVEQLGSDVKGAEEDQANLQSTVTAISDERQSVSGVSLDEEMTNLVTYQRGYQASARTLTVMSELLETLIEHTGTVGL
jgi:flagellar hook-associated protein 1